MMLSLNRPKPLSVYKKLQRVLLVLVLALPGTAALHAQTTPAQDTWMTVLLDGRKVGHAHFTRAVDDAGVTTQQNLHLELKRDGHSMVVETRETDVESRTGQPLQFHAVTRLSGIESAVSGKRRRDGRFDITRTVGGKDTTSVIERPAEALLAEGQRLAALRAGTAAGTKYTLVAWDVNSGKALVTHNHVLGKRSVTLPGGRETLLRVEQTSKLPIGSIDTSVWLDSDWRPRNIRTSMLGMKLELLACDRACAMAPSQGVDILDKSMAPLPRALGKTERKQALTYRIATRGDKPLHFATTDEQHVRKSAAGHWQVEVRMQAETREGKPVAADTAANEWLQSDNRRLRQMASKAVRGARSDSERMQMLQELVSRFINKKNLSVGYASALEVMRNREGDCTEHAVLLAALARALDIPARVVTGLAYTDHYAGRDHVLVPHAWVQAWVGGHWRSFDAALNGFDTGHIALETGDGDPWHFFAAVNTLGNLKVTAVTSTAAH